MVSRKEQTSGPGGSYRTGYWQHGDCCGHIVPIYIKSVSHTVQRHSKVLQTWSAFCSEGMDGLYRVFSFYFLKIRD